jgi:hypothetical protein
VTRVTGHPGAAGRRPAAARRPETGGRCAGRSEPEEAWPRSAAAALGGTPADRLQNRARDEHHSFSRQRLMRDVSICGTVFRSTTDGQRPGPPGHSTHRSVRPALHRGPIRCRRQRRPRCCSPATGARQGLPSAALMTTPGPVPTVTSQTLNGRSTRRPGR